MARLADLLAYSDELLFASNFDDYCPNGLQVEGRLEVQRLVTGVTACQSLLDQAAAANADAVLVHHGLFWKGEDPRILGMKRQRLATLLRHGISLVAYHLPLDDHSELGNNVGLARVLGAEPEGRFGRGALAWHGSLPEAFAAEAIAQRLGESLGRIPMLISGGDHPVRRMGWCSGAAQDYLEAAAAFGLDLFVSGEVSERTFHIAREMGIHFIAAGHHATERFGVQALGERLAEQFGIEHFYIDVDNPV